MTRKERWNATQCAEHWGVSESRWRGLVSTGRAPKPLPGYDPVTGRKMWDAQTVRAAKHTRPGQGYRTDLHLRHTVHRKNNE